MALILIQIFGDGGRRVSSERPLRATCHVHATRGWAYEVESSGDESDDENPSGVADWDPERASRAAWAALAFCRSYRLPSDLPEPCSICLDTLCHGQEAWRLPCTHIFHAGCIARCFGMRVAELICPLCRCDIRRIAVSAPEEISVRAPVFAG